MAALVALRTATGKRIFSQGTSALPEQWQNKDAFAAFCFSLYLQWLAVNPCSISQDKPRYFCCTAEPREGAKYCGCLFYAAKGSLCVLYGLIQNSLDCAIHLCASIIDQLDTIDTNVKCEGRWTRIVTRAAKTAIVALLTESQIDAYNIELVLDTGESHIICGTSSTALPAHAVTMRRSGLRYVVQCRFSSSDGPLCAALMCSVDSLINLLV